MTWSTRSLSMLVSTAGLLAACSVNVGQPGEPAEPTEVVASTASSLTDAWASEANPDGIGTTQCQAKVAPWPSGSKQKRNITFVAFGDPQAVSTSLGFMCGKNNAFQPQQMDTIRDAINDIENHQWPSKLSKAGKSYDQIRGVLMAGDLTQSGSDPDPIPMPGLDCTEYTRFRKTFGFCGTESGALKYPTYETFGNHDFPWVRTDTDGTGYHPVLEYLDGLVPKRAEAGSADYYYDPNTPGTGHYAWRWDDIWFVSLGVKPSDKTETLQKNRAGYDAKRLIDPQNSIGFLKGFLDAKGSKKRQVVLLTHYPMNTGRIKKAEKKAFCALIDKAQKQKKLADEYPVILLHGHTHHSPKAKLWKCPKPYRDIEIPQFDLGSPFHYKKHQKVKLGDDDAVHPNLDLKKDGDPRKRLSTVSFTVFHLGNKYVEAVGIGAHVEDPTKWHVAYKQRLGILKKP